LRQFNCVGVALTLVALLSACASSRSGIGTTVDECCPPPDHTTFHVLSEKIPAFLGPVVVSNFNVALASYGMQPVEREGDLAVTLNFEYTDLTADKYVGEFQGATSPGGDVRFMATIEIEMRDNKSGEKVWSGSVQRVHPVRWMRVGRASTAFLHAFTDVLRGFPYRTNEIPTQ
jgi:hypothetical protein